jgi:hypothetical protein
MSRDFNAVCLCPERGCPTRISQGGRDARAPRTRFSSRVLIACAVCGFVLAVPSQPVMAEGLERLAYVEGSSVKVCQLTGDEDRQTKQPTLSRTAARAGVVATDLGSSFEHHGRLFFLFGDTWRFADGRDGGVADDVLAWTDSRDPGKIKLSFHLGANGQFSPLRVPGIRHGPFEVPLNGVSLGGRMFVVFATDASLLQLTCRSVLAVSDDDGKTFRQVYELSTDKFRVVALWKADPWLYIYGSGDYRRSNVCLARVKQADILRRGEIRYFQGTSADGSPQWSEHESDATVLFDHKVVGELSVAYCPSVARYVMLYNSTAPRGIAMRSASQPWGPWSELEVIFDPWRDKGYGHFMHVPGLFGLNTDRLNDPGRGGQFGGEYGPYIMARFTKGDAGGCRIYYTMSTWNPYQVVVMRSDLRLARSESKKPPP